MWWRRYREPPHVVNPTTLQTRKWRKNGEASDLTTTEILLVSNSTVQFFEKQKGINGNGSQPTGK